MDISDLRYIVFCLDSKFKDHDGKIFISLSDARQFATVCMEDHYCDKFIIGMFVQGNHQEINISKIETFGFKNSKKDINQRSLF